MAVGAGNMGRADYQWMGLGLIQARIKKEDHFEMGGNNYLSTNVIASAEKDQCICCWSSGPV